MADETECRFEGVLNLPRDQAFSLVVDRPVLWWVSPFDVPDTGELDAEIEPFAGGSCYETDGQGHRRIWGTVLSIESPLYVRLAWQVSLDGREIADPAAASRVMINFRGAGESTRLEIVHNEFLRHGEHGSEYLNFMCRPDGWPRIVENLQKAARGAGSR
ncbi:SRPBCC domain-containing protein [Labrenzia sp. OB1]|uniref:SRPBCC domain-containing protein n=1 Tax=Labrenzia sp. OB1 TaxID=1561204 RepID=UPI0007B19FE8|nr:SRPBCC domain-containing protein [Labrenzia sp. OB1]KZM51462.1 hypothetical protein OA90_03045 [Labrenzia sp. OB1]